MPTKKPCIQLFGKAVLFLSHDCGTGVYCCNLVKYSGSGWWIAKLLYSKIGFDAVGWLTDRRVALKTIVGIEVWRLTGFAMLTFIAGIKNISKDYFEAASLDGAGVVQTAYYITIPQLTPTILLNLIMYVITELKTFDIPMLMTKGEPMDGTRTIAMYIYETAFQKQDMGYACAISLFFVIGIMILTCVQFITSNRWVHYD